MRPWWWPSSRDRSRCSEVSEDGRGPPLPPRGRGSARPSPAGPGAPAPSGQMPRLPSPAAPSLLVWARRALAPPPPGWNLRPLRIPLPRLPPPRAWSLPSTPRALRIFRCPSAPSPGPSSGGRLPEELGVRGRRRLPARPGCALSRGTARAPGRGTRVPGVIWRVEAGVLAALREMNFESPPV